MAAIDAFEWYVAQVIRDGDSRIEEYVRSLREYLLTLRSEDERQRFVDGVIDELRERASRDRELGS